MDEVEKIERNALIIQASDYCILYGWSIREIADNMMVSKSSIHRWLTEDLKYIDSERYQQCKKRLAERGDKRW